MAEIDGGGLHFTSTMDNDQINAAIEETLRRVQGLSDGTVASGKAIDSVFNKNAQTIQDAYDKIGFILDENKSKIADLETKYKELGIVAGGAFSNKVGSSGYQTEQQQAIVAEITLRKQLIKETEENATALDAYVAKMEAERQKINETAQAHVSMRGRIRELKEEMMLLVDQGIDEQSEAYQRLKNELGRLIDIQSDVAQQGRTLANDEQRFQGIITGLSGLAGGFSAVTGTVSLFADENDNLNKVMTKVQSAMAITIGLQQVAQTLNKDSAFRLVTLAKAQQLVGTTSLFLGKAFVKMGLSASSAKLAVTALYATFTLGLSLAISGVIALIDRHNKKQEESKQKTEELAKSNKKAEDRLDGLAKKYSEQVAAIQTYRNALNSENLRHNDKLKVIKKLQEIIPDYTAKLNKEGKVIWDNKAAIDAYLGSLEKSLKFKAAMEDLTEIYAEIYKLESAQKPQASTKTISIGGKSSTITDYNALAQKHGLNNADDVPADIMNQWKQQEESLLNLQKDLTDKQMVELQNKVKNIQKYISNNGLLDLNLGKEKEKNGKDPFTTMLEERKKRYDEYFKWINAGFQKEAQLEFAKTLASGKTYKDYLQSGLDTGVLNGFKLTKEQIHQVTNEIATETDKTLLDVFKASLAEQLNNAQTVIDQLNTIQKMRDGLKNDDPLKTQKTEVLDEKDEQTEEKRKEEIERLKQEYADYTQQRLEIERKFNADKAAMYDKNGNLVNGITQAHLDEWQRKYTEALASLDNEFSGTTTSIETLFGDMSQKTVSDMRAIASQAQEMMDFVTGGEWDADKAASFGIKTESQFKQLNAEWAKSPEKLAAVKKAIKELLDEADNSETAFNKMSAGLKKVFSASGQADLQAGLDMVSSGLSSVTEMGNMFADSLRNIADMSGNDTFSSIADGISQVMDVANGTMQGAQAGAAFGPVGAAVGAALGLVSSVTKIFAENKKHREELKKQIAENNEKAYFGEFEVNRLYRERYEWAQKIGEAELSYIKRNGEELKKQTEANSKDQDELWQKLLGTEYKTGEHFEKTGLFGWGKGKTVTEWATLAGKTWSEIEMLAGQGKLSEEGQKYYEALKAAKDEGEDLAQRQEEYLEQVRETFTGSTYDSIVNSIIDGFKAGKRSAADFADTFEGLMQGAIASALQMAADEKTRQFYEEFAARSNDADGLTEYDIDYLNQLWNSIINSLSQETANLETVTGRKLGNNVDTSLTGAVKGVSEETASIIGGQMNAIRINQMETTQIIRQQLLHLANIDRNTGAIDENTKYNRYLKDIYDKMSTGDSLRSKGFS